MNEIVDPYEFFALKMDASEQELKESLSAYDSLFAMIYNLYQSYMKQVGMRSTENMRASRERAENILASRYEFGFDLDKLWLNEKEAKDLLSKVIRDREKITQKKEDTTENTSAEETPQPEQKKLVLAEEPSLSRDERNMRLEFFYLTWKEVFDTRENIESTLKALIKDRNNPKNIEQMLDLLISIRYKEKLIAIADALATNLSKNGIVQSREEFLETLKSSKSYKQLHGIYEQVATQEKREELIPEFYVRKNMSDISQVFTVSGETVERLLSAEKRYESEYIDGLISSYLDQEERMNNETAENQKHDYGWGIVLTPARKLIDNEVVNTPIFKGRITVENIGAFSEHSLFQKRKYARDYTVRVRERAQPRHGLFQKKLERATTQRTMREYYYKHEASKILTDNIWRITKTDTHGRTTTNLIFTPLNNVGRKGSALSEFIKNVYLSDYMIEMAQINGGYAGRVMQNANGFFIANRYNYEEISSAILFQHGQKGDILDYRDRKHARKYTDVTKDKFLELVKQTEREKEFNE